MIRFRKLALSGVAAMTLGAATMAFMQPASAQQRHHHHGDRGGQVAAGVIGGLALGALAAGAANGGYDYGPGYYAGPGYAAPVYGPGYGSPYRECRTYWRRSWDGARERVRECY